MSATDGLSEIGKLERASARIRRERIARPEDYFDNGFNAGLDASIRVLERDIKRIESEGSA